MADALMGTTKTGSKVTVRGLGGRGGEGHNSKGGGEGAVVRGGGCGNSKGGGEERVLRGGWSTLQVPSPTPIGPDSHPDSHGVLTFPLPSHPPMSLEF